MDTLEKRRVLWWLLLASLVSGVVAFLLRDSPNIEQATTLIANLIFTIGMVRWFVLDARLHAYRMPQSFILYMVVCSILVVPYYFIQTRRRDAWKSLLKSLAFLLVTIAVQMFAYLGSEGVAALLKR